MMSYLGHANWTVKAIPWVKGNSQLQKAAPPGRELFWYVQSLERHHVTQQGSLQLPT